MIGYGNNWTHSRRSLNIEIVDNGKIDKNIEAQVHAMKRAPAKDVNILNDTLSILKGTKRELENI